MLILTCGINGSYVFTSWGCFLPGDSESPRVDTVGAGAIPLLPSVLPY